jgi:hypothetical protein
MSSAGWSSFNTRNRRYSRSATATWDSVQPVPSSLSRSFLATIVRSSSPTFSTALQKSGATATAMGSMFPRTHCGGGCVPASGLILASSREGGTCPEHPALNGTDSTVHAFRRPRRRRRLTAQAPPPAPSGERRAAAPLERRERRTKNPSSFLLRRLGCAARRRRGHGPRSRSRSTPRARSSAEICPSCHASRSTPRSAARCRFAGAGARSGQRGAQRARHRRPPRRQASETEADEGGGPVAHGRGAQLAAGAGGGEGEAGHGRDDRFREPKGSR